MPIEASIVRIRTTDRDVVGTGFLVDEQHIFTCAHVVMAALDLPEDSSAVPPEPVWLDFPLIVPKNKKLLTAKVVQWLPGQKDGSGDIAVLELQTGLPEGAEAVCFAEDEDFWKHPFRAFGFPEGQDDGVWATGRLLGRQATNWIMIEDVKAQGFAVIQGFSGGPVWDEQLQGVVGMVVAASRQTTVDKTAFVIPMDELVSVWEIQAPSLSLRMFLSFAPGDAVFAERIGTDLKERGIVVWDEQHGPDGAPTDGEKRLQQAIRSAQAVVLVVSSQTRTSRSVKEHLRLVDLYRRRLILVWTGDDPDTKPQHYGWRETTWIAVLHWIGICCNMHRIVNSFSIGRTNPFSTRMSYRKKMNTKEAKHAS
ncbi:MAG: hypothetical protein NVS4B11_00030 [Ktedonobacteraceae bacterium]